MEERSVSVRVLRERDRLSSSDERSRTQGCAEESQAQETMQDVLFLRPFGEGKKWEQAEAEFTRDLPCEA